MNVTFKMKNLPSPSSFLARLGRSALPAAPLALVALPSAQAQIVHTILNNGDGITLGSSNALWISMDSTGFSDTAFIAPSYPGNQSNRPAGYSFYMLFGGDSLKPYAYTPRATRSARTDGKYVRIVADGIFYDQNARAALLAPGTSISANPDSGFFSTVSDYTFLNRPDNPPGSTVVTGPTNSSWTPGTRGYLGISLNSDAEYGWLDVSYNSDKTLTLFGFAYEASGGAILAGQTSAIPEPSTFAALAGLLAGSAALYAKRRRQPAPTAA